MSNQPPCDRVVLIVDDDPSIRESLADVIGDEGYSVMTAVNGMDALAKLRGQAQPRPCLILLDLMMPVMNGPQFYTAQQQDPALASIPVIVISADGNVGQKASSLGCEYLAKPVRIDRVLGALQRYCN